jgi:hypothetical protein
MSTTIQLPRHIQSIIDEAVPSALKLYSLMKNKENCLSVINNHISSNTLPRSLQLPQVNLVIPKNVLEDEKNSGAAEISRQRFQDSLQIFQREALVQIRTIAEYSVDVQNRLFLDFMKKIDRDIITFQIRFLEKLDSTKANNFKNNMDSYPFPSTEDSNMQVHGNEDRSTEVQEVLEFIKAWRSAYADALHIKLETEVAKEINREKTVNLKEAAEEDLFLGDGSMYSNNIVSVQDLIRRELQPLKETMHRFEIEMSKFKVSSQPPILEQAEERNGNKRRKLHSKAAELPSNTARSQKGFVQDSGVE